MSHTDWFFLSQLHKCVIELEQYQSKNDVENMRILMVEHQECLDDSAECIDFIGSLCHVLEQGIIVETLSNLRRDITRFWQYIFNRHPLDIFFYGCKNSIDEFIDCVKKENIGNVFFTLIDEKTNVEDLPSPPQLELSLRPIMIYDDIGSTVLVREWSHHFFGVVRYQVIGENSANTVALNDEGFEHYLVSQFEKLTELKRTRTAIIGSSYSYNGCPTSLIGNAINLSVPNLDISQSKLFLHHLENENRVDNYIFCFGSYDMYRELWRAKSDSCTETLMLLNKVNHHYDLYNMDKSNVMDIKDDFSLTNSLSSVIEWFINYDWIKVFEKKCSIKGASITLDNQDKRLTIVETLSSANMTRATMSLEDLQVCGETTARANSKFFKYKHSFPVNQKHLLEIKQRIQAAGKKVLFVIPPLPYSYASNLDNEMYRSTSDFLALLADNNSFFFHDFTYDKDFTTQDFRDAHHLNLNGAEKFCVKLSAMGFLS